VKCTTKEGKRAGRCGGRGRKGGGALTKRPKGGWVESPQSRKRQQRRIKKKGVECPHRHDGKGNGKAGRKKKRERRDQIADLGRKVTTNLKKVHGREKV